MEWPYEKKQLLLQSMDAALPGFKAHVQMDPSERFDIFMKVALTLGDADGNGKLSAEEMFEAQTGEEQETIKEMREKIKRLLKITVDAL